MKQTAGDNGAAPTIQEEQCPQSFSRAFLDACFDESRQARTRIIKLRSPMVLPGCSFSILRPELPVSSSAHWEDSSRGLKHSVWSDRSSIIRMQPDSEQNDPGPQIGWKSTQFYPWLFGQWKTGMGNRELGLLQSPQGSPTSTLYGLPTSWSKLNFKQH